MSRYDRYVLVRRVAAVAMVAGIVFLSGCDSVQPSREGTLVLEAYLEAGKPLPAIRVARTWATSTQRVPGNGGVAGADVELILNGATFAYHEDPKSMGLYRPDSEGSSQIIQPFAKFLVSVRADYDQASASGMVPPAINLRNISFSIPDEAIEAVFLDSLDIGIDSLGLSVDARQGYIYPVQVELTWDVLSPGDADPQDFWIETRLEPLTPFSSSIIDFFLLRQQVLPEEGAEMDSDGRRRWTGVYAVPVETASTPIPEHGLKAILLRGDQDFARFETSRDSPERREPVSNIVGGIGFVGGISLDSLTIIVN